MFLDKQRTIKAALRERTTIIMDTEEAPWDVFDEEARARVPVEGDVGQQGAAGKTSEGADTRPAGKTD